MEEHKYCIHFPNEQCRDKTVMKLEACARAREKITKSVLGHRLTEPEWIVFDDCLSMAYDKMLATLKVLDEKAG